MRPDNARTQAQQSDQFRRQTGAHIPFLAFRPEIELKLLQKTLIQVDIDDVAAGNDVTGFLELLEIDAAIGLQLQEGVVELHRIREARRQRQCDCHDVSTKLVHACQLSLGS